MIQVVILLIKGYPHIRVDAGFKFVSLSSISENNGRTSPMKQYFLITFCFLLFASCCIAQPDIPQANQEIRFQISSLRFSPDGKLLAAGIDKLNGYQPVAQEIKVWDVNTGQLLWRGDSQASWGANIAFSPDSKKIAMTGVILKEQAAQGSWVALWDSETGEHFTKIPQTEDDIIWTAMFSPDGTQLIGASSKMGEIPGQSSLKLWDVQTGQIVRSWDATFNWGSSLDFSTDKRLLFLTGWQFEAEKFLHSQVLFYSFPQFERTNTVLLGKMMAESSAISPDSKTVAVSGNVEVAENLPWQYEVSLWDRVSGKQGWVLMPDVVNYRLSFMAFSPDGQQLIGSGIVNDPQPAGAVWLWNVQTGELQRTWKFEFKSPEISRLFFRAALSPDGKNIAIPIAHDAIEVRSLPDWKLLHVFQ